MDRIGRKHKRVAVTAKQSSKNGDYDVVSKILDQVDERGKKLGVDDIYQASSSKSCETNMRKHQSNSMAVTPLPKNFLPQKRHPLMEKCQKSVKFMKHNRSIPKPRAHLSSLREETKRKSQESSKKRNSEFKKNEKRTKIYHPMSSESSNESSGLTNINGDSDSTSESDTNFETFINEIKTSDQLVSKKRQCKKNGKTMRDTQSKHKREKSISQEIQKNDFIAVAATRSRKAKSVNKTKNLKDDSKNDDGTLETAEANIFEDPESRCTEKQGVCNLSALIEKENIAFIRKLDRTEVGAVVSNVDETAWKMNSPVTCSDLKKYNCEPQIVSCEGTEDSDDDCKIVLELPKPNSYPANINYDDLKIQISSVVSLGEGEKKEVQRQEDSYNCSNFGSPSNDFSHMMENLKFTINQTKESEIMSMPDINSSKSHPNDVTARFYSKINSTESNDLEPCQTISKPFKNTNDKTVNEEIQNFSPLSHINFLKKAEKADLKNILFVANNKNIINPHQNHNFNNYEMPCSSKAMEPTVEVVEQINDTTWNNIREAVNISNSEYQTLPVLSCTDNVNSHSSSDNVIHSQTSVSKCNLDENYFPPSTSELQNIISTVSFQNSKTTVPAVEKIPESPADEFDSLCMASVRDLCLNPNDQQSVSPFIDLLDNLFKEYKILNEDKNLPPGLQTLRDSKREQIKRLIVAINHIKRTQSHPRNSEELGDKRGRKAIFPEESDDVEVISETKREKATVKICNNCARTETKIKCKNCEKVFFCSEVCGNEYWTKGHYKECTK